MSYIRRIQQLANAKAKIIIFRGEPMYLWYWPEEHFMTGSGWQMGFVDRPLGNITVWQDERKNNLSDEEINALVPYLEELLLC